MKDRTKQILVKIGAFLFAVAIIVTVSVVSKNTMLKASEDDAAVETVREKADSAPEVPPKKEEPKKEEPKEETKKEVPAEQPAEKPAEEKPVEEAPAEKEAESADKASATEEIPISEIEEEKQEAEQAEEEFDVKKAYKHYISLNESEQEKYLDSLSSENRNELLKYIKKMEAQQETSEEVINEELENIPEEEPEEEEALPEEEPANEIDYSKLKVSFTSDHAGKKTQVGEEINLKAQLEGFDGLDYTVFWEYSEDGGHTFKVDGKGMTHTVIASEKNSGWIWRVNVILN